MQILAISELNQYLRLVIDSDQRLQLVWVEGEVSNFRRQPSGHIYFVLKDDKSQLSCVWFASKISMRTRIPRDGDMVVAHGRVGVFWERGAYQLYVNALQPAGAGLQRLQLEELRGRLEREGLFDQSRKRKLPRFPRTIGVVTSPAGAVFRDILNVIQRRWRGVEVVLAPTPVQGEGAADQIANAIEVADRFVNPDVILVARGGGSYEDLGAFNSEGVARAIYASRAPVVSAVGHESDWTLADQVADLRAPTPSAAAELVVPDVRHYAVQIDRLGARMRSLTLGQLDDSRRRLSRLESRLTRMDPQRVIGDRRQTLDELAARATHAISHRIDLRRAELIGRQQQIEALNPLAVLARGFSITRLRASGQLVRRKADARPGATVDVQVADGMFGATVEGGTWAQATIPLEGMESGARDT